MAFKLTAAEETLRKTHQQSLADAHQTLMEAHTLANGTVNQAVGDLNLAIQKYNEILEKAETFRETVETRLQEEFDGKSDKWQEGDEAGAAQDMIDKWGEESEDVEEVEGIELSLDEPEDYAQYDDLPTEAE